MFYKGDFFDIIGNYEDGYFDLCVTDPPYNVDAKAHSQSKKKDELKISYDDLKEFDDYYDFSVRWFEQAVRTCKMVVFSPGHSNLTMWHHIMPPKDYLFHHKPDGQGFSSNCMTTKTEVYLVYGSADRRFSTNTIKSNIDHHIRYGVHPHPKPRSLYEKILKDIQPKRVLDPFTGSGNLLFACEKMGVEYLGCEINPEYWNDIDAAIEQGKSYRSDSLWEV